MDAAATAPVEVTKPNAPGLETAFKAGEQIPWKGLWFEVATVSHDRILLKPVGMTFKRYKEIKEAKR